MANYLALTTTTEKFIKNAPKVDLSTIDIETIRSSPDIELPLSIPRPTVDVEQMNIAAVNVHVYRPLNTRVEASPAVVFM